MAQSSCEGQGVLGVVGWGRGGGGQRGGLGCCGPRFLVTLLEMDLGPLFTRL